MSALVSEQELKIASKSIISLLKSVIDRLKYRRQFSIDLVLKNPVFDYNLLTFTQNTRKPRTLFYANNTNYFVQLFLVMWKIKGKTENKEILTKR